MKYYLRGFGVGVVFVTILFLLIRKPEELTDAQVQSRAAALGMLTSQEAEEKRLSAIQESELKWKDELEKQKNDYEALLRQKEDGTSNEDNQKENEGNSDQKDETNSTEDPEKEKDDQKENNGEQDEQNTDHPSGSDGTDTEGDSSNDGIEGQEEKEDDQNPEAQTKPGLVKIEIRSGMHAGQVADLLEENGIVESAEEFQRYLKEQNRQTLIQVGKFEFRQGEDFDVIIDAITRR